MSVQKIVKTIYKLELTEETYRRVVELMQSAGNMETELEEFGVSKAKYVDEFVKKQKENGWPICRNPYSDIIRSKFKLDKLEKECNDFAHRAFFTAPLPNDLINLAVIPCDMLDGDILDLKVKTEYSNPFTLDNFKFISGKSRKGDKFGAISIYEHNEDNKVLSNLNFNHYNAIQLIRVIESMLKDAGATSANRGVIKFSMDNEGNILPLDKDNDNIVYVFFNAETKHIIIDKKGKRAILNMKQAQEFVNFVKQYKEME